MISRAVEDVVAVQQLYARYCFTIDTLDIEGFAETFAQDGSLEIHGGPRFEGPAGIRSVASRNLGEVLHIVSNVLVGGGNADYLDAGAYFSFISRSSGSVIGYGFYEDVITRRPDGSLVWQRKRLVYLGATPEYAESMGFAIEGLPVGYRLPAIG